MPDVGWLLQEILASWVIAALGLAGAAMLAILRKYWASKADLVLYGAAGFVLVVMPLLMFQIHSSVTNTTTQEPQIRSDENLEETIRGWADSFGWGVLDRYRLITRRSPLK